MGSQGEHAAADAVDESDAGAADDAGHREVGLGSTAPVNDLHAASCRGFRSMSGGLHPYPRTSRKDGLSASSLGGPLVQILEDDLCRSTRVRPVRGHVPRPHSIRYLGVCDPLLFRQVDGTADRDPHQAFSFGLIVRSRASSMLARSSRAWPAQRRRSSALYGLFSTSSSTRSAHSVSASVRTKYVSSS